MFFGPKNKLEFLLLWNTIKYSKKWWEAVGNAAAFESSWCRAASAAIVGGRVKATSWPLSTILVLVEYLPWYYH